MRRLNKEANLIKFSIILWKEWDLFQVYNNTSGIIRLVITFFAPFKHCYLRSSIGDVLWQQKIRKIEWSQQTAKNISDAGIAREISVNYTCSSIVHSETLWSPMFSPSRFCKHGNLFSICSEMKAFSHFPVAYLNPFL